jgi:serine/threonine protein kinase
MGVFQSLSVVALRQVVRGACTAVGMGAGGDAVVNFLTNRFTDHSQKLTNALQTANEQAWRALEIALGGESLLERIKVSLARAEDQAFREQVRDFLNASPLTKTSSKYPQVFQQALKELRAARSKGSLMGGQLAPDELAREAGAFARFSDQQALIDAEWKAIGSVADNLREYCPNLFKILVARSTTVLKPSILAVAVRYYFRRQVETDPELFRGLAFAKLEALEESQAKGFDALTQQGERLKAMLDDVMAKLGDVKDVADEVNARVQGIEQQIQRLLEQLQLQNREVRRSDSLSVRSDGERQLVQQLIGQYRALPEEKRQQLPALLNNVGKLEVATGDLEAAQRDFHTAASLTADPKAQAEAHHNAYQAALERQQWPEALSALQQAVALDPVRFTPFPPDRYEPRRILGAGGFGVVFLCQHRHLGKPLVIKSLLTSELNRDIGDVFGEARALEELDHRAIIRLRDCDYADAARSRPYLVMDFFEGVNLESYVATQGPLSPQDLLGVAVPVAEALQAAHARGILHRDVKPANILVRKEGEGWRVKLIDFGLALRPGTLAGIESSQGLRTQTTIGKSIAGTLHFAAPEQMGKLPGVAVGPYSDVFGFGKTCYYALLATSEPDDVERDSLPEQWRKFLSRCTGRTIANRLPDFAAVLAGLRDLAAVKTPVGDLPPPPPPGKEKAPPPEEPDKQGVVPAGSLPLYIKSKGIKATGYEAKDTFVVVAGSQVVKDIVASAPASVLEKRTSFTQQGILVAERDCLVLKKDCTFESPSMAAAVLLGRNANGRLEWKDADGRTLKEIQNAPTDDAANPTSPDRHGLRKRFWQELLNRPRVKGTRHANITPSESGWIAAGSGVGGLPFTYVIGQDDARVELYIDRGAHQTEVNKSIFDQLHKEKKRIEGAFGSELSWQRLNDKRACRIAYVITVGGYRSDESKWPEIQDAMIDAMTRLEKAFAPHLPNLNTEMDAAGLQQDKPEDLPALGVVAPAARPELESAVGVSPPSPDQSQADDGGKEPPQRGRLWTFWRGLLSRPKIRGTRFAEAGPRSGDNMSAESDVQDCRFKYTIGQNNVRVEFFIGFGLSETFADRTKIDQRDANKRVFDRLHTEKSKIEKAFGGALSWKRRDEKDDCWIYYGIRLGGYNSDESEWPAIQDAMIDAMVRLEEALKPHIADLKKEFASEGG